MPKLSDETAIPISPTRMAKLRRLPSVTPTVVQSAPKPTKSSKSTDHFAESFLLGIAEAEKHLHLPPLTHLSAATEPKHHAALLARRHTRLTPFAALSSPTVAAHLSATSIAFQLVSSDIVIRRPYLGASAVHVYIPSVAVGVVIERLEMVVKEMGEGGVYEISSVLGFLGERCACGESHWEGMGWWCGKGVVWPGELGLDREGVMGAVRMLKEGRHGTFGAGVLLGRENRGIERAQVKARERKSADGVRS